MNPRLLCHCSFVPTRLLDALGFETMGLAEAPMRPSDGAAGRLFSPRLCGCMQALACIDFRRIDGVILCNCCASAERLYDRLRRRYPELFVFLLEMPCTVDNLSLHWMKARLEQLLVTLHNRFQLSFPTQLEDAERVTRKSPTAHSGENTASGAGMQGDAVWLIGSGIHPGWIPSLRQIFCGMRLEISDCLSARRGEGLVRWVLGREGDIEPCPRMAGFFPYLEETLARRRGQIRGVIGMTVQRCDFGLFGLPAIRQACRNAGIPVLLMEEEFTHEILERSRIRYEAFYESLTTGKTSPCKNAGREAEV